MYKLSAFSPSYLRVNRYVRVETFTVGRSIRFEILQTFQPTHFKWARPFL